MSDLIVVQIVGAPVACAEGVRDTWRDMAKWASGQLRGRFGDAVRVDYYDLFDPDCPSLAPGVELPLVLIDDEVISSGGKLPMPAIRKHIEALIERGR
jgi:disulfide oxidoreductase YuzD